MIAAIAAKEAASAPAAFAPAVVAPAAAAPVRANLRPVVAQRRKKTNPKAPKCPELREPVQPADGGSVTELRCKECKVIVFYKNWG